MRILLAFFVIALTAGAVEGDMLWENNITVDEYGMTWSYKETITGMDSIAYRINLDEGFGDNDSFVAAWEVLKADKAMRKELRSMIDKEPDVMINNETAGIEVTDVDATLSPDLIGKTHASGPVVNEYRTVYRWKDSIFNAGSIWFMGEPNSSVKITMPRGVDVINITGMDTGTLTVTDHAEISGSFGAISGNRGEITLALEKNFSFVRTVVNVSNYTLPAEADNSTKPMLGMLNWVRTISIFVVGLVLILLIYLLKVKRMG